MTTKPKARRARVATEAEAAALNFEPWKGEINTELLPNDEQFTEDGLGHLRTCRFALVTMYKNKAELAEMLGQIENEDGLALMNSFEAAKNFFSRFSEFLDLAEARIIVAGSAYLQAADVADRLLRKIQRSHGLGA